MPRNTGNWGEGGGEEGFVPAVIFEGMIVLAVIGVILAVAIPAWTRYADTREIAAFIAREATPGFGKVNPQPILVTFTGFHWSLEGKSVRLIPASGPDGPAWRCRADAPGEADWTDRLPEACREPQRLTAQEILSWEGVIRQP